MNLDVSQDFDAFDQHEAIDFVSVLPAGEQTYPVAKALRRPLAGEELELLSGQLALAAGDVAWHVPASALSGVEPRPGDRIVRGAEAWLVVSAARVTLAARWRLVCRRAN